MNGNSLSELYLSVTNGKRRMENEKPNLNQNPKSTESGS